MTITTFLPTVTEEQQIPTPQINNLSFVHPVTPLLLGGASGETICTAESPLVGRSCHDDYCECLHLYKIPLGATVDLVLIDEGTMLLCLSLKSEEILSLSFVSLSL